MASVTQTTPWRVALLNLIRGQKTVTSSSKRRCAAAMCSCLGCDRKQYQAGSALASCGLCGIGVLSMVVIGIASESRRQTATPAKADNRLQFRLVKQNLPINSSATQARLPRFASCYDVSEASRFASCCNVGQASSHCDLLHCRQSGTLRLRPLDDLTPGKIKWSRYNRLHFQKAFYRRTLKSESPAHRHQAD